MARKAVTRREVLDISARLFATHGYRSTSLEHVSDRLGVTRQALYYHFKNKGEILAALFEEMMTKLESAVGAVPEHPEGDEPRFVHLLRAHIDVTVANAELVALLLHERPEIAKLRNVRAAKRRKDYARLFVDAYDEGATAGELAPVDPWTAVNTLISAANGVSWWYHGEGTPGTSTGNELKRTLFALLARGFLVGGVVAGAVPAPVAVAARARAAG